MLCCSIWWQFIPYFLVGVSEVFANIGTMELFYTQVGLLALHPGWGPCTVWVGEWGLLALL